VFEVGHILKTFYELYDDPLYNDAFLYSFGFNGYLDCLNGLKKNIDERKVNTAVFLVKKEKKNNKIMNYYAALKDGEPVKNNVIFKKNIIITGPNASGKTTILKSSLINIIFTQQFGFGFYDSMKICPYKHIHCYLNIPDTSGRDSLFQAEARRCKEIIDVVDSDKKDTHFCAFDELYSGTNPDEAATSASAFMEYLVKNANVSCLLTTHFVKVCKQLKKNKMVENYHMKTDKEGSRIKYLYKLEKGISTVKGGINVLSDMNYPQEILDNTIKNS
jgi:DNA mismatch repair ATPase MutS